VIKRSRTREGATAAFGYFCQIRWWNIKKRISAFEAVFNPGNLTRNVVEVHSSEWCIVFDFIFPLYEVSFPDPLAVPRGLILQVAAKQHVISTHARDQVTHITKVCVKSVPTPDGLF
jgi:hypothetical protein